jgi:hypothetical protein
MSGEKNINVNSYNQRGGITAYQVNVQQPQRELNDNLKKQFKKLFSGYSFSAIDVTAVMGDQEAFRFASQIKEFLVTESYDVHGVNQAVFTKPVQGQIVEKPNEQGVLKVIIGGRQ